MEPEQLNGASAEGAGQQQQTESVEEAAQVTNQFLDPSPAVRCAWRTDPGFELSGLSCQSMVGCECRMIGMLRRKLKVDL